VGVAAALFDPGGQIPVAGVPNVNYFLTSLTIIF
jgi:hypothetical protein